jgi:hypothetical protein
MSIIISDPSQDNPILWSFGKVTIKFNKPLDPMNIVESYKNVQKPKIEYTFAPENQDKKSIVSC